MPTGSEKAAVLFSERNNEPENKENIPVSLAIERLSLFSFRNYDEADFFLDSSPVLLIGPNGSGKTNALEAISLLMPGRGLRRASLAEIQKRDSQKPWAVYAEISASCGRTSIGTGRDPKNPEKDRRTVHINGKEVKNQQSLAEHVSMAWITPEMDKLLVESPSARRRLLDRFVYSFDPTHAERVHRYEKAMRERLRLLKENSRDFSWLNALENVMAQTGVAICAARLHLLKQLKEEMKEISSAFPRAEITLFGAVEEAINKMPAILVEEEFRKRLFSSRKSDSEKGSCSYGVHRSDLLVEHYEQKCPVNLCSTGEQKALLISIMLSYGRVLGKEKRAKPLLLLDDVMSHLDVHRREALLEELSLMKVQAWLTGTDVEFFRPFDRVFQQFLIKNGKILSTLN